VLAARCRRPPTKARAPSTLPPAGPGRDASTDSGGDSGGIGGAAIAGIIIGVLILIVAAVIVGVYCCREKEILRSENVMYVVPPFACFPFFFFKVGVLSY
jgi:hypothetical protein